MVVIQRSDGSSQEGVLLSLHGDTVRIAGKGSDDILEFRLRSNNWVSEDCDIVTFSFPLAVFEAIGIMPDSQIQPVRAPLAKYRPAAVCGPVN
jgi:hypothetical protein